MDIIKIDFAKVFESTFWEYINESDEYSVEGLWTDFLLTSLLPGRALPLASYGLF